MRMTSRDRTTIVTAAIGATFDPELDKLKRREDEIARDCFAKVFTAKERKLMASLPDGWLGELQRMSFSVGGEHRQFDLLKPIRVPNKITWGTRVGTITDRDIIERLSTLTTDKSDYVQRRRQAEATLNALLAGCSTFGALREIWPEGERFYKALEQVDRSPVRLPAPQIAALNDALGLKARKRAA